MFGVLRQYCRGNVLDVGGWDFFLTAKTKGISFQSWTTLECAPEMMLHIHDPRFRCVLGDGCCMSFDSNSFDTVLNIQVLEHVFDPLAMVKEIARVLKPDGYGVFLIPQTNPMHLAPHHYYNFTRFWIREAMEQGGLTIIELTPIGGMWASIASDLVYFFLKSFRCEGWSVKECRRSVFFYLLFPVMALYALVGIPICLLLSIGDLTEDANNHLVVVQKKQHPHH